MTKHPEIDLLTYLDADLFFFSSPAPLFEELEGNSILIVEHRFSDHLKDLERWGIYNVGLLAFRSDSRALRCLRWWRERCLEWCFNQLEPGRYADQKYLDEWPERFEGVKVVQLQGAGLGPWNVSRFPIRRSAGAAFVGSQPLIFFHFHHLVMLTRVAFDPSLDTYSEVLNRELARSVYVPYVRELVSASRRASAFLAKSNPSVGRLLRALMRAELLFVIGPVWVTVDLGLSIRRMRRALALLKRNTASRTA